MFSYKDHHTTISVFVVFFDSQPKYDVTTSLLTGIDPNKKLKPKKNYTRPRRDRRLLNNIMFFLDIVL